MKYVWFLKQTTSVVQFVLKDYFIAFLLPEKCNKSLKLITVNSNKK